MRDRGRLAAGDWTGIVRVWDITDLSNVNHLATFNEHSEPVNDLVFLDESGDWLASARGDTQNLKDPEHAVRIWNVPS